LGRIACWYASAYIHVEREQKEPSQSHAWVELHSPSAGWVPFDPTHNRAVDERYVVVGHGRHYDDVPPNKGIYRGAAKETLRADVHTQPSSAPTLPQLTIETRPIPLQTFREAPARRPVSAAVQLADEEQQQQQRSDE